MQARLRDPCALLALYLERGGRTALTHPLPAHVEEAIGWQLVAASLREAVRGGSLRGITVGRIDGGEALASSSPLAGALVEAGFHTAPQGLRLRR